MLIHYADGGLFELQATLVTERLTNEETIKYIVEEQRAEMFRRDSEHGQLLVKYEKLRAETDDIEKKRRELEALRTDLQEKRDLNYSHSLEAASQAAVVKQHGMAALKDELLKVQGELQKTKTQLKKT